MYLVTMLMYQVHTGVKQRLCLELRNLFSVPYFRLPAPGLTLIVRWLEIPTLYHHTDELDKAYMIHLRSPGPTLLYFPYDT